jgi:hypothetical protein
MRTDNPLDTTLSSPVVELLARAGDTVPKRLRPAAASLIRAHLSQVGESSDPADEAGMAALPSTLARWGRELEYSWKADDVLASLLLSASRLTEAEESFILDCARERPYDIGDLIEDPAIASALAHHRPQLLLRLAGCYYLDRELFADRDVAIPGAKPQRRGLMHHLSGDEEDEDGVRDHSSRRPLVPLASFDRGPFRKLLDSDPGLGTRLVGAVVDTATRARIRLEERYGDRSQQVEIELLENERRTYIGTPHVWVWYRMHGVGPYPAMSALMALRSWALDSIEVGRQLKEVVLEILRSGESLALVAVALSVVLDNLDQGSEELDRFLSHPSIWRFEIQRHVQESSPLGPRLPNESRLRLNPSQIAMSVVLAGDSVRREQLRKVGEQLVDRYRELAEEGNPTGDSESTLIDAELQVSRWATELNIEAYRAESVDDRLHITVELPEETRVGLEQRGGQEAALVLELYALTQAAVQMRDGDQTQLSGEVVIGGWKRINEIVEALGPEYDASPLSYWDALSVSAAALIRIAALGKDLDPELLVIAARLLLEVAMTMPPLYEEIREMAWESGADRSAAVGLPLLLDEELCNAAGSTRVEVTSALLRLASSPLGEVRSRLAAGLLSEWDGAPHGERGHEIALKVLEELIASSGYGPWTSNGRSRIRLDPIPPALEESELVGNVVGMADAIPGLVSATWARCVHSERAAEIMQALIEYDRRVWPDQLARHHYSGHGHWRHQIDSVVADRVLSGDEEELWLHMSAFSNVAEDLTGLLQQLASQADTPERATTVHNLWPRVLDALLPQARPREPSGTKERHPHHRDVEELDRALLLAPEGDVVWPWERTLELLVRWTTAFQGRPHVADRLIEVLSRLGYLGEPAATRLILLVLGTDGRRVARESRLGVAWLKFVLVEHPEAVGDKYPVRRLLDDLAAQGEEAALALQQQIEA